MSEAAAPAAAPSSSAAATTPSATESVGSEAPAAAAAPAAPETKPAPPKHWELKVNGKTKKFTEEELISRASLAEAAQERFSEAAKMRRQAEAVIGRIRDPKNVISALQDPALGLSKDQIREAFEEWYSKEFIEPESLTPDQKKVREAEAKIKKYEEAEKAREAETLKTQQDAMTTQARERVQTQILEALESGKLPKTNFTIRRLAYWMQRNHANGFDAPTSVLISQVRNEATSSLRELVDASDGEVMIQLLGENIIQKLRKYDLEQLRKSRGQPSSVASEATPGSATPPQSERPPTSAEVNQRIRQLQKTGRY